MDAATIAEWREVVEAWESDRSKTNPYMSETTGSSHSLMGTRLLTCRSLALSQDGIRLRLSETEATALASGALVMLHDEVTPSMYISMGLDLEHQQ